MRRGDGETDKHGIREHLRQRERERRERFAQIDAEEDKKPKDQVIRPQHFDEEDKF
jgi:hypothetical protein